MRFVVRYAVSALGVIVFVFFLLLASFITSKNAATQTAFKKSSDLVLVHSQLILSPKSGFPCWVFSYERQALSTFPCNVFVSLTGAVIYLEGF